MSRLLLGVYVAAAVPVALFVATAGPRAALAKLTEKLAMLGLAVIVTVSTVLALWTWWLQPQIAAQVARIEAAVPHAPTLPTARDVKDSVADTVRGVLDR